MLSIVLSSGLEIVPGSQLREFTDLVIAINSRFTNVNVL